MSNTEQKILEVFRKHKTPKGGVIRPQSFNYHSWERRSQDEFAASMENLLNNDYISIKDDWYVLTEKGYLYIYKDYSIEDTENIIMQVFRKFNVGANQALMQNNFITTMSSVDRFHFDNFDQAIENLINKNLLEAFDNGLRLTQAGYDYIY